MLDDGLPVWTCSPFNIETLVEWGTRRDGIELVPFAITPGRAVADRAAGPRVELLCVGRLVPAKAQHVVIEALATMLPQLRHRCRLRIAGNELFSSPAYVESLRQLIIESNLETVVELVGCPDDHGLWRLYEESHVLIAPSQHEGLCVPVIEAYHAGCRVVASDAGNLPFVVQAPDPVVAVGSVGAFAGAIESVVTEVLSSIDPPRPVRAAVAELLEDYSPASARARTSAALEALLGSPIA